VSTVKDYGVLQCVCVCVCVAVTLYTLSKTKECCNVFVCLCVVVTLYVNRTVIVQKAIGVQGIKR